MNKNMKAAADLAIGDRLDSSRKTRVAAVLVREGVVTVKTVTTGTRSASVRRWDATATVATY